MSQPTGYSAFIPKPLPPEPPLKLEGELQRLLSSADRALGRLDGVATTLPNPNLFVAMYVRQEAVLSSQIEGTQSTLEDLLTFESEAGDAQPADLGEIIRYVAAMNHGLKRLPDFPLSLRLIKEIHAILTAEGRGSEKSPGEFRLSQNWIGPSGVSLKHASFVPPPPHEVLASLGALEHFMHEREGLPALVQAALIHAQFETIHPFLDGNGRIGRLLITLFLCEREILGQPLLYLSIYLKRHRTEYYDRLTAIRARGDWESWVAFFLRGVIEVSKEATNTAREILALREQGRTLLKSSNAHRLLDYLFEHPIVSVRQCETFLESSYATASKTIEELEHAQLLVEFTGQKRNRRYRFAPYLRLFEHEDDGEDQHQSIIEITGSTFSMDEP